MKYVFYKVLFLVCFISSAFLVNGQSIYGDTYVCPGAIESYSTNMLLPDNCSGPLWSLSNPEAGTIAPLSGANVEIDWSGLSYGGIEEVTISVRALCLIKPDPDDPFEPAPAGHTATPDPIYKTIRLYPMYTPYTGVVGSTIEGPSSATANTVVNYSPRRLMPTGSVAPYKYRWYFGGTYMGQSDPSNMYFALSIGNRPYGNYWLEFKPVNECGVINPNEPIHRKLISVVAPCTPASGGFSSPISSACTATSYPFQVSTSGTSPVNVSWPSSSYYTVAIRPNTGNKIADITFTGTGSIPVKATVSNSCGSVNLSHSVNVVTKPASTGFVQSVGTACEGATRRFEINASGSYSKITWPTSSAYTVAVVPNTGGKQADITFRSSGAVKAIIESQCGNITKQKSVTVTPLPAALACADCPTEICDGLTRPFILNPGSNTTSLQWQLPAGVTASYNNSPLNSQAELTFTGVGTRNITVTPYNGSCAGQAYAFSVNVSDDAKNDNVSYSHSELSSQTPVKELVLNGCKESVSTCEKTLSKLHLYGKLDVGETYDWGEAVFTVSGEFELKGYSESGPALFTRTISLSIDQEDVEQIYHEAFTTGLNNLKRIVVTPKANTYSAIDVVDPAKVRFRFYFEEEEHIDVSAAELALLSPANNASVSGKWEQNFTWQISNSEYCIEVPNYEFQLIRVYGDEVVDWSQALRLYTWSPEPAVTVTIAEGSGTYKWRVRPVGSLIGDIINPANWSDAQWVTRTFTYTNPDDQKNWIYSRTFTEGNKVSEQLTFANGLQQVQQQQTRVSNRVVATQTYQDYAGRNALSTLPVPQVGIDNKLGYKGALVTGGYSKSAFDDDPRMAPTMTFNSQYYSGQAMEGSVQINNGVASAGGYPYTRTVFTNDGTGRIKEQSGVGTHHRIGSGHTIRTYYSGASESEMVMLFGDEAPIAANVQKITTFDANATASITYQNKDGKVLATALTIGAGGNALIPLESQTTAIYEQVDASTQLGPFLQSTRKPLFFTMPRDLNIDYTITPAMLSEVCGLACRTCDYRIEIVMHNLDALPGEPAETLLASHDIAMSEACATNAAISIPVQSFSAQAETNYVLEKRVITNNNIPGTDLTYLEDYLNTEISEYTTGIDEQLQTILNLLHAHDMEGLKSHLAANYSLNTEGQYVVPVLCGNNILISLPEICEEDPVATGSSCTWNGASLAQYFNKYWAERPYNENGDVYTIEDLFVVNKYTNNKVYYTTTTFDQMVANLYSENNDVLSCATIWDVWKTQVAGYGPAISAFADINVEDEPDFVYEYVVVKDFLDALEGTLLANLPAGEEACVDGVKTYFTRNNSDLYGKINGQERAFNLARAYAMVYYNEGDDADEDTQGLRFYFNHLLGQAKTYKPTMTDFSVLSQCDRYKLTLGGQGIQPGEGDPEKYRLKAITQCGKACEGRREAFKQGIIHYLVSTNPLVKIQFYDINEVHQYDSDGNTVIKYVGLFDETVNPTVYDYSECEIDAMAEALVQNCKDNYCQLDFWTNPLTQLEELGTPEQLAAMEKIFKYDFEVQVNEGNVACDTGWDKVYLNLREDHATVDINQIKALKEFEFGKIVDVSNPADYDNVWIVTKNSDPDPTLPLDDSQRIGTLRWAVEKSNLASGSNLIKFDIPGTAPHVISLVKKLEIEKQITLDGSTQPGNGNLEKSPKIILQDSPTIPEMEFGAYLIGVKHGANGTVLQNLHFKGNSTYFIFVFANYVRVVGNIFQTEEGPNVSSFIKWAGDYGKIQGNILGTDLDYQARLGAFRGIDMDALRGSSADYSCDYNLIGGSTYNEGNIVAYNLYKGISWQEFENHGYDYHNEFSSNMVFNTNLDLKGWAVNGLLSGFNPSYEPTPSILPANHASRNVIFNNYVNLSGRILHQDLNFNTSAPGFTSLKYDVKANSVSGKTKEPFSKVELFLSKSTYWTSSFVELISATTSDGDGYFLFENVYLPFGHYFKTTVDNVIFGTKIAQVPGSHCYQDRTLCFRWTTPYTFNNDGAWDPQPKTCEEIEADAVLQEVEAQRQDLIDFYEQDLEDEYTNKCVKSLNDQLGIGYDLGTHHYTLYYYDRAGNLIRTVPPEGVNPLDVSTEAALNSARSTSPPHEMVTSYQYNSLGQMVAQETPDAGATQFWYNDIGQLRFSQNAQQSVDGTYSYTKYDHLGRIVEVGQSTGFDGTALLNNRNNQEYPATGEQVTKTVYTESAGAAILTGLTQRYLQNRVSYTYLDEDGQDATLDDRTYTIYSYDPHGNVEWLVQNVPGLGQKLIEYEYDLLSGNVLQVSYNPGNDDQFYHKYEYDADNRIIGVYTSRDGHLWDKDATYEYYPHGPLKEATIGEDKLQNLDYLYTIHGWLKGINNPGSMDDPAAAADAFAMSLNYYSGDYQGLGTTVGGLLPPEEGRSLYNGNISAWETASRTSEDTWMRIGNQYTYDELNRIRISNFNVIRDNQHYTRGGFHSDFSYDANGNLQMLNRNDIDAENMDALVYHLQTGKNRLSYVEDNSTIAVDKHKNDIENQPANNYTYDAIGNLTYDTQEKMAVEWTVYGKVESITHQDDGTTRFKYDAAGNRVVKSSTDEHGNISTNYYVRDASGNIMAVYKATEVNGVQNTVLQEVPIYGSDRLGAYKPKGSFASDVVITSTLTADKQTNVYEGVSYLLNEGVKITLQPGFVFEDGVDGKGFEIGTGPEAENPINNVFTRTLDKKQYELKDHLGNVRAVISDRKLSTISGTTPSDFRPSIASAANYYPFGMDLPPVLWDEDVYLATMEINHLIDEYTQFENYMEAERVNSDIYNHTDEADASYATHLNGTSGNLIGLAKTLKVQAGDKISMEVYGKYYEPANDAPITTVASSLGAAFIEAFNIPVTNEANSLYELFNDLFAGGSIFGTNDNSRDVKAYLNYLLFDENYVLQDAGYTSLSPAALEDGTNIDHEQLLLENVVPEKDGYIYVYLSNESAYVSDVYFDDFKITHEHLIPDEGLNPDLVAYRYGFNGKEKDQSGEFGLNHYDYGFRIYNPALGRFLSVDPLASEYPWYTPYQFAGNTPIQAIDLDGQEPRMHYELTNATLGKNVEDGALIVLTNTYVVQNTEQQFATLMRLYKAAMATGLIVKDGDQHRKADNRVILAKVLGGHNGSNLSYQQKKNILKQYHSQTDAINKFLVKYDDELFNSQERNAGNKRLEQIALTHNTNLLKEYRTMVQEEGKSGAIEDIITGSVSGVFAGVSVVTSWKSGGAELYLAVGAFYFAGEKISGGIRTLHAIEEGVFDPNKDYRLIGGLIQTNLGNGAVAVYDLTAIGVDLGNIYQSGKTILTGKELNNRIFEFLDAAQTSGNSVKDNVIEK
ncbi:hypothetical protein C900_04430 [Fulvivirga imtechensis AK7]|uniref:Uncharacterized protein n=1 Tax=Fulvivirga imtechensis AK7 TaxID=1237149 RepID=L8JM25_9BACT|nr:RHS repeat-associated core domain-containing protein [Fulvivirga imtechensis]ELR69986.1 hypothetical protein C900_04430 [Fulvivirga imtechensis AK7]